MEEGQLWLLQIISVCKLLSNTHHQNRLQLPPEKEFLHHEWRTLEINFRQVCCISNLEVQGVFCCFQCVKYEASRDFRGQTSSYVKNTEQTIRQQCVFAYKSMQKKATLTYIYSVFLAYWNSKPIFCAVNGWLHLKSSHPLWKTVIQ